MPNRRRLAPDLEVLLAGALSVLAFGRIVEAVSGVTNAFHGMHDAFSAFKAASDLGWFSRVSAAWDALTMRMRTVTLAADPRSRDIRELPPEGYGQTCAMAPKSLADEIDLPELRATLAQLQLIDVREAWERAAGAILPSAHLPLAALQAVQDNAAIKLLDPAKPTVVYCTVGARGRQALPILRERHGFMQVRSLRGGYQAWCKG